MTWSLVAPPTQGALAPREPPRFSVVTAAYRVADFVGAAIESAPGLVDAPLAGYRVRQGSLSSERAGMGAGEIAVLEKILRRDDLSEQEAAAAGSALAHERRELVVAQAREALRDGRPETRSLALAVAHGKAQGTDSRTKGLLAAAAPGTAGAIIPRRGSEAAAGVLLAPAGRPRWTSRGRNHVRG